MNYEAKQPQRLPNSRKQQPCNKPYTAFLHSTMKGHRKDHDEAFRSIAVALVVQFLMLILAGVGLSMRGPWALSARSMGPSLAGVVFLIDAFFAALGILTVWQALSHTLSM
jgi:hypothetical protein